MSRYLVAKRYVPCMSYCSNTVRPSEFQLKAQLRGLAPYVSPTTNDRFFYARRNMMAVATSECYW